MSCQHNVQKSTHHSWQLFAVNILLEEDIEIAAAKSKILHSEIILNEVHIVPKGR